MRLLVYVARRAEWFWWVLTFPAVLYLVYGHDHLVYRLAVIGWAVLVGFAVPQFAWRLFLRLHGAAIEREDAAALREMAQAVADDFPGEAIVYELYAPIVEERYEEVRARCAAALAQPDSRRHRATLNRALAWATALGGDPEGAISIAESALADASMLSPAYRAAARGTLGMVLVLARRPADGLVELERAFASGGPSRTQAIRSFYMGEALRALNRTEEARHAYTRCIERRPPSRWIERARTARDTLGVAYR